MTRLLLIDDEVAVLTLLELGLKKLLPNVEVVVADSGKRALHILDEQSFDLVITDILMPDIEGLEIIEHLNRCHPETLCVATSGGSGKMHLDVLSLASALGARATLFKPLSLETLARTIRGLLRNRDGD